MWYDDSVCISFWYHGYGAELGSLSLYLSIDAVLQKPPMWRVHGASRDQQWHHVQLAVNVDAVFQVNK